MKTLMLWQCSTLDGSSLAPEFIELEGDYRKFDNIYIGAENDDENQWLKLDELMFKDDGQLKYPTQPYPSKDWDFFIHCGCLP